MRRLVLTLTAAAVLGLAAGAAEAGNPHGWYGQPNYGYNYAPNYGYQANNYYYGGGAVGQYYSGGDFHSEAVRRIMAAHSRYRFYTHPLSTFNSPPTQADYFGWGWGY